jgi:F-type H+-transporting ATPase subunit epsilon
VTVRVEVLVPDRELWSGTADMVIAKTMDGDIGVYAGHAPMFGILSEGSLVRIVEPETGGDEVRAAVTSGFLSITAERVSVLAAGAVLGDEVDRTRARQDAETATAEAGPDSPEARYARAQLRAAGEQA